VLITNHVLAGAVLGHLSRDPATAAGAGFVSHFVMDALPHFGVDDIHLMKVAVPDGLLGLAVIGLVLSRTPRRQRLRVAAGIFGACLPDVDKPSTQFFGSSPFPAWFDGFHGRIQRESERRFPVETTAALTLTAVLVALARRSR
jgi:hypothetical protein